MRTRRTATTQDLRLAVDCLPRRTRIAMLAGIEANDIIVGAYSTREGICPMLAAHRAGGRTSLISFAEAWDRLAFRDARRAGARRATERELLILRSHLEASLLADEATAGVPAGARSHHEPPVERPRRRAGAVRPGDPDRARELSSRAGSSWTRVVRRYDEYERLMERVGAAGRDAAPEAREPSLTP